MSNAKCTISAVAVNVPLDRVLRREIGVFQHPQRLATRNAASLLALRAGGGQNQTTAVANHTYGLGHRGMKGQLAVD